jgi:hypothetical protein
MATAVDTYRWLVTVKRDDRLELPPYCREVTTDGPRPEEAASAGLKRITDGDNDLWQADKLTITVERVR